MQRIPRRSFLFTVTFLVSSSSLVWASGDPMRLVGSVAPIPDGVYSSVVVDEARGAAYMGSAFVGNGVSVIDMRDRAYPALVRVLPRPGVLDANNQTEAFDVDLVGRYLLISYFPTFGLQAFRGLEVYDISTDPFNPTLLRTIPLLAFESSQLDPEVESGRPYAYCNRAGLFDAQIVIVNILTGEVLSTFVGPEPNLPPFEPWNHPHEAMVQRHPRSGRMLDYVGYWDSGLRIIDVTDPRNPVEVGSFDYGPGTPHQNAHGAVVTPSGNWVYVGDELSVNEGGGVHVLDTSACDGTSYCTPTQVGFWHIEGHNTYNPNDHAFTTWLSFDVHNMDPRGENALLVGNYKLGVRLLDTTDKSAPEEISFYLPNNNGGGADPTPFIVGRRTWVALFGSDNLIYASDMTMGFFVLRLNQRTVLPAAMARRGQGDGPLDLRVESIAGRHRLAFTTSRAGVSTLSIFDVSGRRVAEIRSTQAGVGRQVLEWAGRAPSGQRAAGGLYLGRLTTPDGSRTVKMVQASE